MNYIKKILLSFMVLLTVGLFHPGESQASGISIDAGLTPAVNRLMVRGQMRYMERNNNPMMQSMEMKMYMFPVMIAYGVRSDLTLMVRQAFISREMTMMMENTKSSGLGDLLILAKYRLLRVNKPNYTIGIAPTVGIELPTGGEKFTSDSYDLRLGTFFSGRLKSWSMDLDFTYLWNGMALTGDNKLDGSDEFSIETAIAYRFGFGENADLSFAPVLETSYINVSKEKLDGVANDNSGESMLMLSPGFKITKGSFIFESLIRLPIWQDQKGNQTELDTGFLVGFRLMN